MPRSPRHTRLPLWHNEARCLVYVICLLLTSNTFGEYRYPIGERATYKIQWGLVHCGTSTISCDEVTVEERQFIRIRVEAKSNWLVSTVYPVNDIVDCYIDPETQLSVRLEKNTSEGDTVCKDVLTIDRKTNWAEWISESANISTNYPVDPGVTDAISFIYEFRRYEFETGESRDFKLAVDATQHGITVHAKGLDQKKLHDGSKVQCRKYLVTPELDHLFVRKVPKTIWLTEDERKILVRMDVEIPVGKARVVLDEYIAPSK